MSTLRSIQIAVLIASFSAAAIPQTKTPGDLPHLARQASATQLIVDGRPFLILGGELGNSSVSSLDYMQPIWLKLAQMNLNTVLPPVYWDLIEPQEGTFDFTLVDGLINQARDHHLRHLAGSIRQRTGSR